MTVFGTLRLEGTEVHITKVTSSSSHEDRSYGLELFIGKHTEGLSVEIKLADPEGLREELEDALDWLHMRRLGFVEKEGGQ